MESAAVSVALFFCRPCVPSAIFHRVSFESFLSAAANGSAGNSPGSNVRTFASLMHGLEVA